MRDRRVSPFQVSRDRVSCDRPLHFRVARPPSLTKSRRRSSAPRRLAPCYSATMSGWSSKLARPVVIKGGPVLRTLNDARAFVIDDRVALKRVAPGREKNHHGYATSARELGAAAYTPKPDIAATGEKGLTSRLGLQKGSSPVWAETACGSGEPRCSEVEARE
jgi:hypothetical protein